MMKKYLIEWETDYCEDFPEKSGECVIEAESEEDAAQRFYKNTKSKATVINIQKI
jgi:hypothetical protein